ncbi:MAG: HlyD family secretion protein [Candidatus Dadabacteria bacterium]
MESTKKEEKVVKQVHHVKENKKKNKVFLIALLILVLAGAWFGLTKYFHGQSHEETDDAQVAANISPVIPRISGYVTEVKVTDNQHVKKGDTLLVLDDRELQIKLQEAEAALATAESNLNAARATTTAASANIGTSRASVATVDAQIDAAKVNVWRATKDYDRYATLVKDHSVTQQQYEQALAAKQAAERQVDVLEQQKRQASQQTNVVTSQTGATGAQVGVASSIIKQRQADVAAAKLNLSYAVVTAPANGVVSKVNVQPGQFLQAGQSFFSIVLNNDLWVIGNFKETQLEKMKVGQKVVVHVDAYPDHDLEARVSSFSAATGSSFSLLPPDNATGNFVKVVQRIPVRIDFTNSNDPVVKQLRAGMNVKVDVHLK